MSERWLVLAGGKIADVATSEQEAMRVARECIHAIAQARPCGGWSGPIEVVRSVARWEPGAAGRLEQIND